MVSKVVCISMFYQKCNRAFEFFEGLVSRVVCMHTGLDPMSYKSFVNSKKYVFSRVF